MGTRAKRARAVAVVVVLLAAGAAALIAFARHNITGGVPVNTVTKVADRFDEPNDWSLIETKSVGPSFDCIVSRCPYVHSRWALTSKPEMADLARIATAAGWNVNGTSGDCGPEFGDQINCQIKIAPIGRVQPNLSLSGPYRNPGPWQVTLYVERR